MNVVVRRLMLGAALFIANPHAGLADTTEDIIRLEHQRYDALIAQDWSAYDALLGEEFFHNHVFGGTIKREPHLAHLQTGKSKVIKAVLDDIDVRLYGGAAVVTGVSHVVITHVDPTAVAKLTGASPASLAKEEGDVITRHSRFLHVWVKQGDDWKLVAAQGTYVPETK